jgi:cation diffusion facilitator CzcD-associated flavoprotein CzcO
MPLLEEVDYMPTEKYARAKELLQHSRMIGEKFDLYSRALFQTETREMRWIEEEGKWVTHTARGDKIKSRFIIPAAGPLHRPKLLGVPGIEDFKGHSFHSSRWDFGYTGGDPSGGLHKLKDKRVGIIGTGGQSRYTFSSVLRHPSMSAPIAPQIKSGSDRSRRAGKKSA